MRVEVMVSPDAGWMGQSADVWLVASSEAFHPLSPPHPHPPPQKIMSLYNSEDKFSIS